MRYKLKLKRLDFVSPVDEPAQQTARVLMIKRREVNGFARAIKVSDELGLVFCWAFTSKDKGADYYDLQSDNIDEDFIKAAAEFMENGGATDEMHDGQRDGRVVFAFPMTSEIAKVFGIETETTGLMVALKPSAEVLAKFKSGEYTGVSIEGIGERTKVAAAGDTKTCKSCSAYMAKDDEKCASCGAMYKRAPSALPIVLPVTQNMFAIREAGRYAESNAQIICVELGKRAAVNYQPDARGAVLKATWTTATIDDLPDSSFLYIEGGGSKDSDGKTTPRSLRHFPYKDENGKIDIPHLRDAISRIPQSSLPATLRNKLQAKAEKLLGKQHEKGDADKRLAKRAMLTTAVAGHVHMLDDGDGAQAGETDYRSMPGDGSMSGGYHSHPWVRGPDDTLIIGEAENHTHDVLDDDDLQAIVDAGEADDDEDDAGVAGKRAGISTRADVVRNAGLTSKENTTVDPKELKKALDEANAKLAETEKRNGAIAKLSTTAHAVWKSLTGADADAFLAKSDADRAPMIAEFQKSNEAVYTAADGSVFTKRDDPRMVEMAKRTDAAEAKAADVELAKRAEVELGHLPGSLDVRKTLLKAIDGVKDEKVRADVLKAVKAGATAIVKLETYSDTRIKDGFELPENDIGPSDAATGAGGGDPEAALRKGVEKYQADHKLASYQQALSKALREGDPKVCELYAAVQS